MFIERLRHIVGFAVMPGVVVTGNALHFREFADHLAGQVALGQNAGTRSARGITTDAFGNKAGQCRHPLGLVEHAAELGLEHHVGQALIALFKGLAFVLLEEELGIGLLPLVAFAILGSSRYLVVAADSATAVILASALAGMAVVASPLYVGLAGWVALLTAGYLLLARLFKLGFLADFLSQTVLTGFLTGVGFQVGIAVLGEMLGVTVTGNRTIEQLWEILKGLPEIHAPTLAVSASVVGIILVCRHFAPRVPGPLIAVAGAVTASAMFDFASHGITIIGPVTGGLPGLGFQPITWKEILSLLPVAGACFVMIVAQSA